MSLHHPNLWNVVNKQWKYKWISYKSVFQGLIIVQIIAIVFSLLGVGNGGFGSGAFHLNVQYVSGDIVFFFTCIWAFFIALAIDRMDNRLAEQIFVSNAMSHHLSNIMFIGVSNAIGAISVIMASFCVKILHIWIFGLDAFVFFGEYTLPGLITFFLTTFFYLILFSGAGYLIGSIMRQGKIMKVATIAIVGGMIFLQESRLEPVFIFFGQESHLVLFITKVLLTSLISFGLAVVFSRRLEVQ